MDKLCCVVNTEFVCQFCQVKTCAACYNLDPRIIRMVDITKVLPCSDRVHAVNYGGHWWIEP